MKAKILIAAISSTLVGCSPVQYNKTYKNPIDDVRAYSYQIIELYAAETGKYIRANGEKKAKEAALLNLRNDMKDPESARFKNVRLVPYSTGKVFCGEVNAKNSYGGYIGFMPFVAGISGAEIYDTRNSKYPDIQAASNAGIVAACGR